MKRFLVGAAVLVSVFLATLAYSQSNATVSGLIEDSTHAVLPGATVTATNAATGIERTAVSNAAGVYNFTGVQVGTYKITAESKGFQTQTYPGVRIEQSAQVKLNFTLQVRKLEQSVEVTVQSENLLLESSSSAGVVLPEKKINELPLVNSNVLSLIKVMGGVTLTENPIFGADDTQFAGVSASNINLQRDGVTVNDVRWNTGLNSPVYLNPEMVGEFKMVLAPVDAELGRGNGQVQVITRSGANTFHGSAVWNNQNTVLDANEWLDNKRQVPRDWRNQNEYILSLGGPIIKNKTFFFVSWDHQFSRIRQNNINMVMPTACARKGIWRWMDGWSGGNILTNTDEGSTDYFTSLLFPAVTATVNADGSPRTGLMQPHSTLPSTLHYTSVFGPLLKTPATNDCSDVGVDATTGLANSSWVNYSPSALYDSVRVPDTSGYNKKFFATYVPLPNNYQVGDGLNWGGFRWVRPLNGGDNIYGLGEGPNRKQISFRIDHNFSARFRVSGTYSYERDKGEDSFKTLPKNVAENYGGSLVRKPQSFSINLTATLRPTLLNETRIGMSRTDSMTYSPLGNPDNGGNSLNNKLVKALLDLYPTTSGLPLIVGLGNPGFQIGAGYPGAVGPWGSGRGNFANTWGGNDPRWIFGDTLTWTKGRHSMKFGFELQLTQSNQNIDGPQSFSASATYFPAVRNAACSGFGCSPSVVVSGFSANQGFHFPWGAATMPGMAGGLFSFGGMFFGGNVVSGAYNLLNTLSGNINFIDQYRFINSPTATSYNDVTKGEYIRYADYRQNAFSIFAKDDWKVSDTLTLNLGLRYEAYLVPYLANGMTPSLVGGAMSIFGPSGRDWDSWMPATTYDANYNPTTSYDPTKLASLAFVGPNSPHPNQQLYSDHWKNFGPAIGFAWQLPWFGKGKTTLRGGYQLTYMPPGRADGVIYTAPKIFYWNTYTPNSQTPYMSLNNIQSLTYNGQPLLPIAPLASYVVPPSVDPKFPVQQRSQGVTAYDPNLKAPYIQNLTLSLTRNIGPNVSVDFRYIGTLSRRLVSQIDINSANIWNNGLKQAFDLARYGGESPLLDKMFNGINLAGSSNPFMNAYGPVGTNFNGVLQTGAMHLRAFSGTNGNLANGNYLALAQTLATLNYDTTVIGNSGLPPIQADTQGAVLRRNNFAENFIYTSPQFSSASWVGNLNHANYHSLQAQVTVRPTHGFSVSGTYVWSRNLGMPTGSGFLPNPYTDPRNRAADYYLNTMNRSHQINVNGAFELPFGPGHWLLNNSGGVVDRIVGGWQLSWIANWATGRPFGIISTNTSLYANGIPDLVGPFDTKSGHVKWPAGASAGNYFWDSTLNAPKYANVPDPQCSNVTALQSLNAQCSLQAIALASDTSKIIFQNPYPTKWGNFQTNQLTQPAIWSADMAMSKGIKITEGKTLQFRFDATNIFNHQQPTTSSFRSGVVRIMTLSPPANTMGYYFSMTDMSYAMRPLGYMDAKVNARTFQAKIRFDF